MDPKEEEADYDFIQAQLSPNPKLKHARDSETDPAKTLASDCASIIDTDKFAGEVKAVIESAMQILAQVKQPAPQLRRVESEQELHAVCQSLASGEHAVAFLSLFEHKLRSYKPLSCWLLMSVVRSSDACNTYLIDLMRFKGSIASSLGLLSKAVSVLKVVESSKILTKLF